MPLQVAPEDLAAIGSGGTAVDPTSTLGAAPAPAPAAPEATSSAALFPKPDAREDDLGEGALVGGVSAVNQGTFGLLDTVLNHTVLKNPEDRALWEGAKDRHELANYGGGALGFGTSMLYGGPLFKAAATAGRAARAGVLGTEAIGEVARAGEAAAAAADVAHFATPGEAAAHAAVAGDVAEQALPKALAKLTAEHGEGVNAAADAARDAVTDHIADKLAPIAQDPGAVTTALSKAPASDLVDMTHVATEAARAAAPSLSRQALAKVVGYAVEGAVLSAPQAVGNAALNDWKGAGEALAWGAGGNVAMGGLGDLLSTGAKAGLEKLQLSNTLKEGAEDLSRRATLRAIGISKAQAKKMGEDKLEALVDWAHNSGIIGAANTKGEVGDLIEQAHGTAGKTVSDAMTALDAANAQQGRIHLSNSEDLKAKISEKLSDALGDKFGINSAEANEAQKLKDAVNALPESPTLQDIQGLKSALGAKTKFDQSVSSGVMDVRQDAYTVVKQFQEDTADAIAKETGDKKLVAQWKQAKRDFGAASDALKGVNEQRAQQSGNRIMGLTDSTASQASALGVVGSLVAGHPLGAAASVAGYMAKKFFENRGLVLGARALRSLSQNPETGGFGLALAQQAKEAWQSKLDSLPSAFKSLGNVRQRIAAGGPPSMTPDQLKDRSKQMDALVNTGVMQQHAQFASSLVSKGAPNAAAAMQAQLSKGVAWLHTQLPRPPEGITAQYPWSATPSQARSYGQKESVIDNPLSVLDRIKDGTLTSDHVLALMQFPTTYQSVVNSALTEAQKSPPNAQQRAVLSTLLQTPVGTAGKLVGDLASASKGPPFGPFSQSPGSPMTAQSGKPKAAKSIDFDKLPSDQTDSQRARQGVEK